MNSKGICAKDIHKNAHLFTVRTINNGLLQKSRKIWQFTGTFSRELLFY